MQLSGIHHLTAISANAPGNRAFYEGDLGMRLVKKTVNQDDVSAYHLFYADGWQRPAPTSPSSTAGGAGAAWHTLDFTHGAPRRRGEDAGLVARAALRKGITHGEISERDGRLTLDLWKIAKGSASVLLTTMAPGKPIRGRRVRFRSNTKSAGLDRSR